MTTTPAADRPYDIVVFGATGFTGRLTAEYLAKSKDAGRFRWALAGRSLAKLEEVKRAILALNDKNQDLGIIICDAAEPETLSQMARQTRVVITTVFEGKPPVRS